MQVPEQHAPAVPQLVAGLVPERTRTRQPVRALTLASTTQVSRWQHPQAAHTERPTLAANDCIKACAIALPEITTAAGAE